MSERKSFFTNNHITAREGDGYIIQLNSKSGEVFAYMDRYRIMPIEDFEVIEARIEHLEAENKKLQNRIQLLERDDTDWTIAVRNQARKSK